MEQDVRKKAPIDDADVAPIVASRAKIGRNKLAGLSAGAFEPEHSMEKVFLVLMWSGCFTLAVSLSLALLILMEGRAMNLMV
jgi:hypothetical protein